MYYKDINVNIKNKNHQNSILRDSSKKLPTRSSCFREIRVASSASLVYRSSRSSPICVSIAPNFFSANLLSLLHTTSARSKSAIIWLELSLYIFASSSKLSWLSYCAWARFCSKSKLRCFHYLSMLCTWSCSWLTLSWTLEYALLFVCSRLFRSAFRLSFTVINCALHSPFFPLSCSNSIFKSS